MFPTGIPFSGLPVLPFGKPVSPTGFPVFSPSLSGFAAIVCMVSLPKFSLGFLVLLLFLLLCNSLMPGKCSSSESLSFFAVIVVSDGSLSSFLRFSQGTYSGGILSLIKSTSSSKTVGEFVF